MERWPRKKEKKGRARTKEEKKKVSESKGDTTEISKNNTEKKNHLGGIYLDDRV